MRNEYEAINLEFNDAQMEQIRQDLMKRNTLGKKSEEKNVIEAVVTASYYRKAVVTAFPPGVLGGCAPLTRCALYIQSAYLAKFPRGSPPGKSLQIVQK